MSIDIDKLETVVKEAVVRAQTKTEEEIFRASQEIVPQKTGMLKGTGRHGVIVNNGNNIMAWITYGELPSGDERYNVVAQVQEQGHAYNHWAKEIVTFKHRPPQTSHYLSGPFQAYYPKMKENIVEAIREVLK